MPRVLLNRWTLLGVGYVLVAVVMALVIVAVTGGFSEEVIVSDRVAVTNSRSIEKPESFPRTTVAAEAVGWKLGTWCIMGQGRFFRQLEGDEPDPLMLVYSFDDKLVGINLYSSVEQPSPPWEHFPIGITTGFKGRDSEHWGLGIYVSRPGKACDMQFRAATDSR